MELDRQLLALKVQDGGRVDESAPICKIFFNPDFLRTNTKIRTQRLELTEQLTMGSYALPVQNNVSHSKNISTDGIGTTTHNAMLSSIELKGSRKPVKLDIFSKPFEDYDYAKKDFTNAIIASRRGINTPDMIALVRMDDEGFVISEFDHLAQPLSLRRLDLGYQDTRYNGPMNLLVDIVTCVADANDRGVCLADMHLGNIGFQRRPNGHPVPILFDFESAYVLSDQALEEKKKTYPELKYQNSFEIFEQIAVSDLADLVAHLVHQGFPTRQTELLRKASRIYLQARTQSWGTLSNHDFASKLERDFVKSLSALSAA